jgi:hypothetical protein
MVDRGGKTQRIVSIKYGGIHILLGGISPEHLLGILLGLVQYIKPLGMHLLVIGHMMNLGKVHLQ